jgi:hypothetical protein
MRFFVPLVACVGIALTAAGCNPVTDRTYFTEGAGVDLYTADRAQQIELQNQYIEFVCGQAGPNCGGNWATFVQAGLNDIDLRCDGFLTWLDARRRDKEPILGEISAVNAAAHTIMTVSGASPKSLEIVTAAFELATQSYINWNSRLLLSVNQSTVQTIVYGRQQDFRKTIANYAVPDRPTAIYLLRNYLRICMPITIEADINTTPTLVQRGDPADAKDNPISKPIIPGKVTVIRSVPVSDDAGAALTKFVYPNGELKPRDQAHAKQVNDFIAQQGLGITITTFLHSAALATPRATLARQLGLIQ